MVERRVAISIVVLAFSISGSGRGAVARDIQSGPTDIDLKAAYCLNVIRDRDSWTQICTRAPLAPAIDELAKQYCHNDQKNIERLKDYLAARGYEFGERDTMPAMIAGNRGSDDVKDCMYFLDHRSLEEDACFKKCMAQKDSAGCFNACPVPASCQRVRKCNDLSFLPF